MDPLNMLLQAALVLGPVRAIWTAFFRILATLDPQVILHVPQPTITLATSGALETTWLPIKTSLGWPQRWTVHHIG